MARVSGDELRKRPIAVWLLVVCGMIAAMVVIGGVTRLTESGLSITEWRPLSGVVPPLGEADWRRLFALYQQTPEYRLQNAGMSLAGFKQIFWWEYVHRLWGRLIGIVFALPLLYFLLRGSTPGWLRPHLLAALGLGALQGLLGWYMVQSGLAERTDVSQYRLTAHLCLALAIYAYLFWLALHLIRPEPDGGLARLRPHLWVVAGLVVAQIVLGGFVAGLNAGLLYNSFPLMGDRLLPDELFFFRPWWLDPFENPVTAQFLHRTAAILLLVTTLALWLRRPRSVPLTVLAAGVLVQAGLGVATLLLSMPLVLAAAHQAGAVAVLTALVWVLHRARAARRARPRAVRTVPDQARPVPL